MGKSITYHVVGYFPIDGKPEGLVGAMSRVEMAQMIAKLARWEKGPVTYWAAQTAVGERILGGRQEATAERVAPLLPKLPKCAVCEGAGCFCCRFSGVARRGNERRWRDWQLEHIRRGLQELTPPGFQKEAQGGV